jgi:murein L,D-transpeptidase YcbB/YkuD
VKALRLSLLALAALAACDRAPEPAPRPRPAPARGAAVARVRVSRGIADFYAARGNRPLWIGGSGPSAQAFAAARRLESAADDGLGPDRYHAAEVRAALESARSGEAGALAHAELILSSAYADYARDVRAVDDRTTVYGEADLAPLPLQAEEAVQAGLRLNPLYEALRTGYGRWRRGPHDPRQEALVRANLDRARAIQPREPRYLIVDAASARLWAIDGERVSGPMRVIVGKPAMETPMLASRIRYVVLNPYWNVPPDLARDRARRVLGEGPGLLAAQRLQILSDWSDAARPIPASAVDWRGVAAGRKTLRLRQLPGGANVMGRVKFMMPNRLGIYLHDFPDKSLFARADRRLSSGCVRLADAPGLLSWVFHGRPPAPRGSAPEQAVELPEAVPVYITYLTVLPGGPQGLTFQPDSYRREGRRQAAPSRPAAED